MDVGGLCVWPWMAMRKGGSPLMKPKKTARLLAARKIKHAPLPLRPAGTPGGILWAMDSPIKRLRYMSAYRANITEKRGWDPGERGRRSLCPGRGSGRNMYFNKKSAARSANAYPRIGRSQTPLPLLFLSTPAHHPDGSDKKFYSSIPCATKAETRGYPPARQWGSGNWLGQSTPEWGQSPVFYAKRSGGYFHL